MTAPHRLEGIDAMVEDPNLGTTEKGTETDATRFWATKSRPKEVIKQRRR
jgi:hypothetical protein